MLEILFVSLPVFFLLAAGYFAVSIGYLPDELGKHLSQFAVKLAVPVLLFRAVYQLDFGKAFNLDMIVIFYACCFICFTIAALMARQFWNRTPGESVSIGFSAFFSNSVMLGIPIADRGFGESVLTPVFGIVVLHAPILYTWGMFTMEFSRRDGTPFFETVSKALKSIFSNPLMIGIAAGLVANRTGIQLPEIISATVNMLAAAAIPVALVSIGAALTQYELKSEIGESLMVTAVSLLVHPTLAFIACHYIFDLDPIYTQAAVLIACMPPGMNGYVFAVLYNRAIGTAASCIVIATALSVITVTAWLTVLTNL